MATQPSPTLRESAQGLADAALSILEHLETYDSNWPAGERERKLGNALRLGAYQVAAAIAFEISHPESN